MAASRGYTCIGVDLGTDSSTIAFVAKGGVDIVQNEVSQRKTPTVVGFNDRQRLLGDSAEVVKKSNWKNTVRNIRHVMGPREFCEEDLQKEAFWQLAKTSGEQPADGAVGFEVNYKGETKTFSTTQILAMYLTKMREISESWTNTTVKDLVISVPAYFNDFQRQALVDASSIAGLNTLRLLNEHTATALAYGIYRTNEFKEEPTITAFAHMGHSNFQISIVSFENHPLNGPGLKVLAEASDRHCAGRDQERVLIEHFAAAFKKKFGCDPLDNKKAILKMEDACSKCKKILSANDTASVSIECLMEDEDMSGKINREEFENLSAPLMARFEAAVDRCIKAAGVPVEKVDFVEVTGGACRVPWFQKKLSEKFGGKELSKTLNADESIARGCALMAAILSPAYKVRNFQVEDKVPHDISITWMGLAADQKMDHDDTEEAKTEEVEAPPSPKLMPVFHAETDKVSHGNKAGKVLTWMRAQSFSLNAEYTASKTKIASYTVELDQQPEKKKVKIEAKVDLNGIFKIDGATMYEQEHYVDIVKEKREVVEAEKPAEKEEKPEMDTTSENPSASADGDQPMKDSGEETASASEKVAEGAAEKKKEKKFEWVEVKKNKKRTKKTPLKVVADTRPGVKDSLMQPWMDVETQLQVDTRDILENDAKRNDLEGYIYAMRNKCCQQGGALYAYVTDAVRSELQKSLGESETWLYDHFDATTLELTDNLTALQELGEPAQRRFTSREEVKEAVGKLEASLRECRSQLNNQSADFAHISQEAKNNVLAAADKVAEWLSVHGQADSRKELFESIAMQASDVKLKEAEIKALTQKVMSEPKPVPQAPEPAPEAAETAEAEEKPASASASSPSAEEKAPEQSPETTADASMEVD